MTHTHCQKHPNLPVQPKKAKRAGRSAPTGHVFNAEVERLEWMPRQLIPVAQTWFDWCVALIQPCAALQLSINPHKYSGVGGQREICPARESKTYAIKHTLRTPTITRSLEPWTPRLGPMARSHTADLGNKHRGELSRL